MIYRKPADYWKTLTEIWRRLRICLSFQQRVTLSAAQARRTPSARQERYMDCIPEANQLAINSQNLNSIWTVLGEATECNNSKFRRHANFNFLTTTPSRQTTNRVLPQHPSHQSPSQHVNLDSCGIQIINNRLRNYWNCFLTSKLLLTAWWWLTLVLYWMKVTSIV